MGKRRALRTPAAGGEKKASFRIGRILIRVMLEPLEELVGDAQMKTEVGPQRCEGIGYPRRETKEPRSDLIYASIGEESLHRTILVRYSRVPLVWSHLAFFMGNASNLSHRNGLF
jgi:hypothetical protein